VLESMLCRSMNRSSMAVIISREGRLEKKKLRAERGGLRKKSSIPALDDQASIVSSWNDKLLCVELLCAAFINKTIKSEARFPDNEDMPADFVSRIM